VCLSEPESESVFPPCVVTLHASPFIAKRGTYKGTEPQHVGPVT
jgi:hypothetical protein